MINKYRITGLNKHPNDTMTAYLQKDNEEEFELPVRKEEIETIWKFCKDDWHRHKIAVVEGGEVVRVGCR